MVSCDICVRNVKKDLDLLTVQLTGGVHIAQKFVAEEEKRIGNEHCGSVVYISKFITITCVPRDPTFLEDLVNLPSDYIYSNQGSPARLPRNPRQ